jgi:hypothetical protein
MRSVTAIVTVHTPNGFVIGADGRQIDSQTNTIQSDKTQKIFSFEAGDIRLAYAWTGTTQMHDSSLRCFYDVRAAMNKSLLAATLSRTWPEFLSRVLEGLRICLPAEIPGAPNRELAQAIFVGFLRGAPCKAEIAIVCSDSRLDLNIKTALPAPYCKSVFTGVERLYERYKPLKPQTNSEAVKFVREYLLDCIEDGEADSEGIGGHLHIAAVTADEFSWVIEPFS